MTGAASAQVLAVAEGMSEQCELPHGKVEKVPIEVSLAYPAWHGVSIGTGEEECSERN